eukprot:3235822-Rhodomonas_salina.1
MASEGCKCFWSRCSALTEATLAPFLQIVRVTQFPGWSRARTLYGGHVFLSFSLPVPPSWTLRGTRSKSGARRRYTQPTVTASLPLPLLPLPLPSRAESALANTIHARVTAIHARVATKR